MGWGARVVGKGGLHGSLFSVAHSAHRQLYETLWSPEITSVKKKKSGEQAMSLKCLENEGAEVRRNGFWRRFDPMSDYSDQKRAYLPCFISPQILGPLLQ